MHIQPVLIHWVISLVRGCLCVIFFRLWSWAEALGLPGPSACWFSHCTHYHSWSSFADLALQILALTCLHNHVTESLMAPLPRHPRNLVQELLATSCREIIACCVNHTCKSKTQGEQRRDLCLAGSSVLGPQRPCGGQSECGLGVPFPAFQNECGLFIHFLFYKHLQGRRVVRETSW